MEAAAAATPAIATVQQLADRYGEAWNDQDLETILSLHSEDSVFQLHVPGGEPVQGREAIHEAFAAFLAQLPDINFATVRLHVGPHHWVNESTLTGTVADAVELEDQTLEAPGASVEVACVDVIQIRDGLVTRKDTYLDGVSFMRQIGAA
jgi:steroid delta-isomerase-like uncharacterized protein